MKLAGSKVAVKIRHTDGTTDRTFETVVNMADPGPVEWDNSYVSVYGNVRNGTGRLGFNDQDLSGILDEVATEALEG